MVDEVIEDTAELDEAVGLTAGIVSAYVANNEIKAAQVGELISSVYTALTQAGAPQTEPEETKPTGAVSAKKSLANPDFIVSMIDGRAYKTLKRHLANNGHTPESYREAFGLPSSYPMVAAGYSQVRRELSLAIGLGRKAGTKVKEVVEGAVETVEDIVKPKRGRPAGAANRIKEAKEAAAKHLSGGSEASNADDANERQMEA